MSAVDPDLVRRYDAGVPLVLDALRGLSEDQLDREDGGGWSARMVVHHLADSESRSYVRLRQLLAEPPPAQIQGYDEESWAQCPILGYRTDEIEGSVQVFCAVRQRSSAILHRLGEADLSRTGVHSESGPYSVADWLRIYAAHAEDHASQIRRAARGET